MYRRRCNGRNAPAGIKSFALIADDPDAPVGTWVHWVIYDLPPATTALAENTPPSPELPDGSKQGVNDFRQTGYGGPCPPPGKPHRYFFKIYALDTIARFEIRRDQEGIAQGDGWPCSGARPVHGDVSTAIAKSLLSSQHEFVFSLRTR